MRYFTTNLKMEHGCRIESFMERAESHMNTVANTAHIDSPPTTTRLVSVTRDWGHMIFFWEEQPE